MARMPSTWKRWVTTMSRKAPGALVEGAATLDGEGLGHVDLHVAHVAAAPQRLEELVGEAQGEDVVDGLLAQEVVDAKDLGLVEVLVDLGVELAGGVEVGAEGLLTDDARVLVEGPGCRAS